MLQSYKWAREFIKEGNKSFNLSCISLKNIDFFFKSTFFNETAQIRAFFAFFIHYIYIYIYIYIYGFKFLNRMCSIPKSINNLYFRYKKIFSNYHGSFVINKNLFFFLSS